MHRAEKCGVQSGIRGTRGEHARQQENVQRENTQIGRHEPRRGALLQFGGVAAPPAESLIEERSGHDDRGERIEFARANEGRNGREDEKE
jgi:hypothetical protein